MSRLADPSSRVMAIRSPHCSSDDLNRPVSAVDVAHRLVRRPASSPVDSQCNRLSQNNAATAVAKQTGRHEVDRVKLPWRRKAKEPSADEWMAERDRGDAARRQEALRLPVVPLRFHGEMTPRVPGEVLVSVGVGPDGHALAVWANAAEKALLTSATTRMGVLPELEAAGPSFGPDHSA
jgi:hypothetical protein